MAMMVLLGSLATAVVTTNRRRRRTNILVFLYYALVASSSSCTTASGGDRAEGRYSFSLTTFDPQGKLGQVERAMEAAALGTPVLCVVVNEESSTTAGIINGRDDDDDDAKKARPPRTRKRSTIVLAAPQVLPSPLMEDDGTSRFVQVTEEIVVSHSGLSADGRVLVAAAQRLAVEHEYTFDESIPIDFFLQQLSLLFQQYTMKAGARPFGCFLIVAYMPAAALLDDNKNTRRRRFNKDNVGGEEEYDNDNDDRQHKPLICRIDPSGCIEKFDSPVVIINGNHLESLTDVRSKLQELLTSSSSSRKNVILESSSSSKFTNDNDDNDDVPTRIAQLLRSSIREQAKKRRIVDDTTTAATMPSEETILTACLSSTGQFCVERK